MFHYSLAAESKESEKRVRAVLEMEDHERMTQYNDILQDIITLYQDPSIQKCLEQKAKFYVSLTHTSIFTYSISISPAARFCSVFPEESLNNRGSRLPPV